MGLDNYSIKQIEEKLHKEKISATEIVETVFTTISETENDIQSFVTLTEDQARKQAKHIDEEKLFSGKLAAIPGTIKDNIVTKGIPTTCSSKMLENFKDPLYDATVVEKLLKEHSIFIGKVNLDEFAMGSSTETSAIKQTRNPWNIDYVPGGSSGGSAASVAAGQALYSIGTDTGGSIRQPSAYCGVVGFKPTYGLVSRYGVVAMAPSLDQAGPITRTVEDNARVLEVIAGHDYLDATSAQKDNILYSENLSTNIKGLKIAVPKEFLDEGVAPEVKESVQNALQMFELLGATWEEVSLPHLAYSDATYYIVANAEASSSLARYDGVRFGHRAEKYDDMIDLFKQSRSEGFGEEVKRRLLMGTTVLSGEHNKNYFQKAQKVRTLIRNDFAAAFEKFDLIIGPTTATPAFKLGEEMGDATTRHMNSRLLVSVNLAGLPAISVPCGFTEEGLPLGLQIIGNHFTEQTIYNAAYAYEQATNHHKKRPEIGGAKG